MRIAVIHFPVKRGAALAAVAKELARGLESQGHQVAIVDASVDTDARLTSYEYLAVGTESASFTGKVQKRIGAFLSASGQLQGKRSLGFILKPAFFAQKACLNLMASMESQGLVVCDYRVFSGPEEAKAFASSYRAER
jgi:hypothetical protein